MHRAYSGPPASAAAATGFSPANPDAAGGDGHLHHRTRPGLSTGALHRATNDGHIEPRKTRTQLPGISRYLRSLYPPEVRIAVRPIGHGVSGSQRRFFTV